MVVRGKEALQDFDHKWVENLLEKLVVLVAEAFFQLVQLELLSTRMILGLETDKTIQASWIV